MEIKAPKNWEYNWERKKTEEGVGPDDEEDGMAGTTDRHKEGVLLNHTKTSQTPPLLGW